MYRNEEKMGKFIKIVLIIILIALICLLGRALFINKDAVEPIVDTNSTISGDILFTIENYPKVDASLATQPLTTAIRENFTQKFDYTDEELGYTNTHPGYLRLVDGEVDLICVTEPSEDELEYAKEHNVELEVIPVVKEGFVFYVNDENPIDGLTLEQIKDIYAGKITNWKEVGGKDAKIKAFQRPENSGSQTGMLSLVMKDRILMTPPKEDIVESMFEIVNLVSSYDNGLDSIGYSYYYYAKTMFQTIDKEIADGIKLLKVDGVEPSNDTIKDGSYPLQTAYYIVMRKDEPAGSPARKLAEAMLSERGQKIAEEVGYVGVK